MAKAPKKTDSFEASLKTLEELVQTMEQGELPLEEALTTYKKGIELLRICQEKLANAEQQLHILEDGELKPMDLNNE